MGLVFCEDCQNETEDCIHLRAERRKLAKPLPRPNPVREYIAALNEAYRPARSLAEFLRRDDGWVDCPCGIRHEPPVRCEPRESLDEL